MTVIVPPEISTTGESRHQAVREQTVSYQLQQLRRNINARHRRCGWSVGGMTVDVSSRTHGRYTARWRRREKSGRVTLSWRSDLEFWTSSATLATSSVALVRGSVGAGRRPVIVTFAGDAAELSDDDVFHRYLGIEVAAVS
jgi:hypothetical protein